MYRTFGQELLHFARAVDIIRDEDFRGVRTLVQDYLKDNFGLTKVELLLEARTQGQQGLAPQWDDAERYGVYALYDDNKQLVGQNAFAFVSGEPIWVVSRGEQTILAETTEYVDLWNNLDGIPSFRRMERLEPQPGRKETTKVLIAVPVKRRGQTYGVISCESDSVFHPNEAATFELEAVCESLGILHILKEERSTVQENTSEALRDLGRIASEPVDFKTTRPNLFLAYAKQHDRAVLAEIRDVLDKFTDDVNIIDWERENPPGDITQWITAQIIGAKYLACYLSDRVSDDHGGEFVDNPNVIFETGMFHALRESADVSVRQWLPIREGAPEEAPFDFRPMRMIVVPRNDKGELRKDRFATDFEHGIRELLADDLASTGSDQ